MALFRWTVRWWWKHEAREREREKERESGDGVQHRATGRTQARAGPVYVGCGLYQLSYWGAPVEILREGKA